MSEKPHILFMGTPEFAVPSLEELLGSHYNVVAVVTQPDRPRGRGRKSEPTPVKIAAEKFHLRTLQPERVRDEAFLRIFREIAPDMVILVAFGQILPKEIIELPPLGCINVHPSLLPKYRGAAPINWTLIGGEQQGGVTIIEMDEKVDAGDILLQEAVAIGPQETYGTLHERLSGIGARLLVEAVEGILNGTIVKRRQDESLSTYAPRLKKEDAHIRWDSDFREIVRLVRGLSPVPAAFTHLDGRQLKVFAASGAESPASGPGGTVLGVSDAGFKVAAKNGCVWLSDVQLEGKKRMPAGEFLKGHRVIGKLLQ